MSAVAAATLVAAAVLVGPGLATAGDGGEAPAEPVPMAALADDGPPAAAVAPDAAPAVEPAEPAPTVNELASVPPSLPVADPFQDAPPPARSAPANSVDPDTTVSSPVLPMAPGYWTPERMADAKPMPMPSRSPR